VEADTPFVARAEIDDAPSVTPFAGAAGILALPRVGMVTSCEHPLALARLAVRGWWCPACS